MFLAGFNKPIRELQITSLDKAGACCCGKVAGIRKAYKVWYAGSKE